MKRTRTVAYLVLPPLLAAAKGIRSKKVTGDTFSNTISSSVQLFKIPLLLPHFVSANSLNFHLFVFRESNRTWHLNSKEI